MILAIAGVVGAGCSRKPELPPAPPPTAVEVVRVLRTDISETVDVVGNVKALEDVSLSAKIGGKVSSVPYREGRRVGRGSVVVQQQTADYENQVRSGVAALEAAKVRLSQSRTASDIQDVASVSMVRQAQQALQSAKENLNITRQGARPQERRQAESQVASARASFENADQNLKRTRQLFAQGAVSQAAVDSDQRIFDIAKAGLQAAEEGLSLTRAGHRPEEVRMAENNVRSAEEQLSSARANLKQRELRKEDIRSAETAVNQAAASLAMAKQALSDSSIITPIAGVVAERKVEPGQIAAPGVPLIRVYNPATVYFEAIIPEAQVGRVKTGNRVKIKSDALPEKVFTGQVVQVYPSAKTETRSFLARIALDNPSGGLKPGMFAKGQIVVAKHLNRLTLPIDAILKTPTEEAVFVVTKEMITKTVATPSKSSGKRNKKPKTVTVEANVAHKRIIQTGIVNDGLVEIIKGLQENDVIVRSGQAFIQDGQEVSVVIPGAKNK